MGISKAHKREKKKKKITETEEKCKGKKLEQIREHEIRGGGGGMQDVCFVLGSFRVKSTQ